MAKLILVAIVGFVALSFCVGAILAGVNSVIRASDDGTLLLAIGCAVLLIGTGITSRLQAAQK